MWKDFFRLRKCNRFTAKKAKQILRKIDRGKLTFDQAKEKGLVPPIVTSMYVLRRIVHDKVFVS